MFLILNHSSMFISVESGNFGQGVNSDIPLQTVKIQMRRLIIMSRLIRIFPVCPVNFVLIPKQLTYKGKNVTVRNLTCCPNLPDFTLL